MWTPSYRELARRRNELASRRTTANLQMALVRSSASKRAQAFVDGALMAEEEINRAGGVTFTFFNGQTRETFSRPLSIQVYDAVAPEGSTSERIDASVILAHRIAADPNVVAVLGHSFDASVAASIVYNACEVIYLASTATEPALTNHRDMPYVFRVCHSDDDIMYAMVKVVSACSSTGS